MQATDAGGTVGEPDRNPAVRASDLERDAALQRVQQAFAEGRLDDAEFDERMRAALTARPRAPPPAAAPGIGRRVVMG